MEWSGQPQQRPGRGAKGRTCGGCGAPCLRPAHRIAASGPASPAGLGSAAGPGVCAAHHVRNRSPGCSGKRSCCDPDKSHCQNLCGAAGPRPHPQLFCMFTTQVCSPAWKEVVDRVLGQWSKRSESSAQALDFLALKVRVL